MPLLLNLCLQPRHSQSSKWPFCHFFLQKNLSYKSLCNISCWKFPLIFPLIYFVDMPMLRKCQGPLISCLCLRTFPLFVCHYSQIQDAEICPPSAPCSGNIGMWSRLSHPESSSQDSKVRKQSPPGESFFCTPSGQSVWPLGTAVFEILAWSLGQLQ